VIRNYREFNANLPASFDGVFMWDFLKGAFGPTIEPMDFDGVVERHNNFLVFETKNVGTPVPQGQMLTLRNLVTDRRFTVVITTKTPDSITGWEVLTRRGSDPHIGDCHDLKAWCASWFRRVNGDPEVTTTNAQVIAFKERV
jgi:hypothetical protein